MATRILVIEDDLETATSIAEGLRESGFEVSQATDGQSGLSMALNREWDALIVDRMLPGGMNGLEIIEKLRQADGKIPVLILSALGSVDDRVRGLRAGGDDYVTKPYALSELVARLETLLRRARNPAVETRLRVGDLQMDLLERSVTRAGKEIDLQPREFMLLEYLMRNAGHVVTRTMLLEHVWDYHFDPQTNVIDVHISRLRQKIDKSFGNSLLQTVRGTGYCLRVPD